MAPSDKVSQSPLSKMFQSLDSVILFVSDIDRAARWYAEIFDVDVRYENPNYAYIHGPRILIGFHPADKKCPGGVGGTAVYWEVQDISLVIDALIARGAVLYRGPIQTDHGASAAMLIDPFGCVIGLNQSTEESRRIISRGSEGVSI